ncbi:hypothetical protein [Flagellimonas halotolerans]|uniref:Lipid/polyisoprenoid-binding YceI-like domain-containing protein n=1 Tax=Flagellimonas halotolerans TaxID=3112164 RepID=A0ABU6IUS7_9FLAO|nr:MULTISPECIES: hypothetical protein [unclassified Allomuricauda]MEC3966781.1 hypothetical protein [Muricauda sp. SYSU M86414]MEC4266703.1 hypothetical protein [Muricauda sp. SYSU M84420]
MLGLFSPPEDDDIIKDITYDTTAKHLTFSFAFTIPGADNVTGNDLHISGEVDITALKAI